ncbi:MAG: Maf family protein [Gammaproteobacteria bacterium]|nr:Maf family protein [Gammaproteobacteria bacterium]
MVRVPVVLASASPRRAELLRQIGIPFEVIAAIVDETLLPDEPPLVYVERLARSKAGAVTSPERITVAADTVVVVDDVILGKPRDQSDGVAMLLSLQGRSHMVHTGLCVSDGSISRSLSVSARVEFRKLDRTEALAYVATGEGRDKAGGYGIQGIGGIFAQTIEGSYSAVVGLPLTETELLLREFGVDTWRYRNRYCNNG